MLTTFSWASALPVSTRAESASERFFRALNMGVGLLWLGRQTIGTLIGDVNENRYHLIGGRASPRIMFTAAVHDQRSNAFRWMKWAWSPQSARFASSR